MQDGRRAVRTPEEDRAGTVARRTRVFSPRSAHRGGSAGILRASSRSPCAPRRRGRGRRRATSPPALIASRPAPSQPLRRPAMCAPRHARPRARRAEPTDDPRPRPPVVGREGRRPTPPGECTSLPAASGVRETILTQPASPAEAPASTPPICRRRPDRAGRLTVGTGRDTHVGGTGLRSARSHVGVGVAPSIARGVRGPGLRRNLGRRSSLDARGGEGFRSRRPGGGRRPGVDVRLSARDKVGVVKRTELEPPPLTCVECGAESDGHAEGWHALLAGGVVDGVDVGELEVPRTARGALRRSSATERMTRRETLS